MAGLGAEPQRGQAMVYEFRDGTAVAATYLEVGHYQGNHFVELHGDDFNSEGTFEVDQGGLYYELPWL